MEKSVINYGGFKIRIKKTTQVINGKPDPHKKFTAYVMKGYDVFFPSTNSTIGGAIREAKKFIDWL